MSFVHLLLGVEPICQKPSNLLNARYTISMPINRVVNSDQLHHNVVVMGGINRNNENTSNITDSDETALMFLLGSVAHFSCNNGYVMTGSSTLMCFSNGSWIGDIGRCESTCPIYVCTYVHMVMYIRTYVCSTYVYICGGLYIRMCVYAFVQT